MPDENPTPGENLTRGDRSFGDMERDALYLLTDPGRKLAYFDPECVIYPLLAAEIADHVWTMTEIAALLD
jgi:hypothetical protein